MTAGAPTSRATSAPAAPLASACSTNSCPSRTPARATNRSPGSSVRVSMETPVAAKAGPAGLPATALAIASEVQSGSAMGEPQGLRRLGDVVEGMHDALDGLALLVALSGHHQDVAGAQHGRGGADRLAPAGDLGQAGGA